MDKIKEKLHIGSRRKSQPENDVVASHNTAATHNTSTGRSTIEDNYGTYFALPAPLSCLPCSHASLGYSTITWPS
jgi:hypothetical protein